MEESKHTSCEEGDTIPDSLMVCGHEIKIRIDPNLDDCYGKADLAKMEIRLAEGLSKSLLIQTLIHETIHLVDDWFDLFDQDEQITRVLANSVFQLLSQNEAFVKLFSIDSP